MKKQADAARTIKEKKGEPTEENVDTFWVPELQALATWKIGKTAKGRKEGRKSYCECT